MSIPQPPPHINSSGIFNDMDYNPYADATVDEVQDFAIFVQKSGDTMTGQLNVPNINLYDTTSVINFGDFSIQSTAFSQAYINRINSNTSNNTFNNLIVTNNITFPDSSIQTTAFTTADNNAISKLANLSYNPSTLTTSISNNTYLANLTCGNINTSYLTGLTSNVQTQLNNAINTPNLVNPTISGIYIGTNTDMPQDQPEIRLYSKIWMDTLNGNYMRFFNNSPSSAGFGFFPSNTTMPPTVSISQLQTNIYNDTYIANLSCGNINTSYLTGLTSNVQTQLNNASLTSGTQTIIGAKTFSSDINTNGRYLNNGYSLIPVGTIMMYAGSDGPIGYQPCQGQSYLITQLPLLFAVIKYTYGGVNGVSYQLPDLRGHFVRGAGTNGTNGIIGGNLGRLQAQSVQSHAHNTPSVVNQFGGPAISALNNIVIPGLSYAIDLFSTLVGFANLTTPINILSNSTLGIDGVTALFNETVPYNMSLNYIIKVT